MNQSEIGAKTLSWIQEMSSYVYQGGQTGSDKRNRNPNWTDSEITKFLTILMEEPILHDLNAQRNKQVFCYVSQKMLREGSEKSWDQCRVKLKNLKSQWRYVRDRVPGIEDADMEDEAVVKQVMNECQTRGVSPTCIRHLRMLKQFLDSLSAVRRGLPIPKFATPMAGTELILLPLSSPSHTPANIQDRLKSEDDSIEEDLDDDSEDYKPLLVDYPPEPEVTPQANLLPPPTSSSSSPLLSAAQSAGAGAAPAGSGQERTSPAPAAGAKRSLAERSDASIRVMSPSHINSGQVKRLRHESTQISEPLAERMLSRLEPSLAAVSALKVNRGNGSDPLDEGTTTTPISGTRTISDPVEQESNSHNSNSNSSEIRKQQEIVIARLQKEMADKFLDFQRETELRYLTWEQERWRLEQNLLERWRSEQRLAVEKWRAEQRHHEKEMLAMFCQFVATCSQALAKSWD